LKEKGVHSNKALKLLFADFPLAWPVILRRIEELLNLRQAVCPATSPNKNMFATVFTIDGR